MLYCFICSVKFIDAASIYNIILTYVVLYRSIIT